jgi:hypothetical protein
MLLARTVIALSLAVFALAAPKGDILGAIRLSMRCFYIADDIT